MRLFLILLSIASCAPAGAATLETSVGEVRVEKVMDRLDAPWAIGFLPDGSVLVTEQDGRLLRRSSDGTSERSHIICPSTLSGRVACLMFWCHEILNPAKRSS